MKRSLTTLGLFATLACLGLHAQAPHEVANIPFDFQMGEIRMPAGKYMVHCPAGGFGALTLSDVSGKHAAIALTTAVDRPRSKTYGAFEFHRYGDTYFFTEAWTPYSTVACALPVSGREKELARTLSSPQNTAIVIARK